MKGAEFLGLYFSSLYDYNLGFSQLMLYVLLNDFVPLFLV